MDFIGLLLYRTPKSGTEWGTTGVVYHCLVMIVFPRSHSCRNRQGRQTYKSDFYSHRIWWIWNFLFSLQGQIYDVWSLVWCDCLQLVPTLSGRFLIQIIVSHFCFYSRWWGSLFGKSMFQACPIPIHFYLFLLDAPHCNQKLQSTLRVEEASKC